MIRYWMGPNGFKPFLDKQVSREVSGIVAEAVCVVRI